MHRLFLTIIFAINSISSEHGIPEQRGLNWYESLPAVAMDYKVHIDAGKCKIRKHENFELTIVFVFILIFCNSSIIHCIIF